MSKFQLWKRDEYGQGSIVFTDPDLNKIIKRAKQEVTDINVNNALTETDRESNWEMYFPIISSGNKADEKKVIFLYGGRGALNKEIFYSVDKKTGEASPASLAQIKNSSIKIYLGNTSTSKKEEKDWYAVDNKRRPITDLTNSSLNGKTMLFVKVV